MVNDNSKLYSRRCAGYQISVTGRVPESTYKSTQKSRSDIHFGLGSRPQWLSRVCSSLSSLLRVNYSHHENGEKSDLKHILHNCRFLNKGVASAIPDYASTIRPPSFPLAVRNPYTNVWLPANELPGNWPVFWYV